MLVEFSVSNYRSILERQTLNMVASSYFKELESLNTFIPDQDDACIKVNRYFYANADFHRLSDDQAALLSQALTQ